MNRITSYLVVCMLSVLIGACTNSDSPEMQEIEEKSLEIENPMEGLNENLFTNSEERDVWLKEFNGFTADGCRYYDKFTVTSEYGTSHYFLSLSGIPESLIEEDKSIPAQYYEVPACGGTFRICDVSENSLVPDLVIGWKDNIKSEYLVGEEPEYIEYASLSELQIEELALLWSENDLDGHIGNIGCFKIPENKTGKKRSMMLSFSYRDDNHILPPNIVLDKNFVSLIITQYPKL